MALGWSNNLAAFRDRWNRLRPLNRHRLANAIQAYQGYNRNKRGIHTRQTAWPLSISVEPTTSCNLRCPECPSGLRSFTRPTGILDVETLNQVLDEIGRHLVYMNLYFQGEPYLHPKMHELVRIGANHGLYTSTSTNAHFLRPERCTEIVQSGLSRLIISIDGMTQDTYSAYRIGGKLNKVLEGTRNMVEAKRANGDKGPHLVWQFLVVGPNEHEVTAIKQHAKFIGVDELVIKTAQIDQPKDGHSLLTEAKELRRYDRNPTGEWILRNPLANECWRMWQGCVMTWDGRVVPCCFDKDAHHTIGKVGAQSFEEIWFSSEYEAFRSQVFSNRSTMEMCLNCSEGSHAYA